MLRDGEIALPLAGLCCAFDDEASLDEEHAHVAAEDEDLSDTTERGERSGDAELIRHLGSISGKGAEEVVVLHGVEGAPEHGVLEVDGRVEAGDAGGEGLPNAEVAGAPGHLVAEGEETGGLVLRLIGHDDGGLAEVGVVEQMDFDAASEVEAAFHGCIDDSHFVKFKHGEELQG